MAREQAIENPEAVTVYADTGNPSPSFRPVLGGKVPRIRNAKDAKKLLGRLISAFTKGETNSEDARTLAYLVQVYVQACVPAEIEERLDQYEKAKNSKMVGAK